MNCAQSKQCLCCSDSCLGITKGILLAKTQQKWLQICVACPI